MHNYAQPMKESFDQCTIKNRKFALVQMFLAEIYGGGGGRGSVKFKALVRRRPAKNAVQLKLTNSVLLLDTRELASCG